jgi:hypothetical protein
MEPIRKTFLTPKNRTLSAFRMDQISGGFCLNDHLERSLIDGPLLLTSPTCAQW